MKRLVIPFCALLCAEAFVLGAAPATGGTNLVDKGSYALGANIGTSFRTQGTEPNLEQFIAGIKDGVAGKVTLSDQELREAYFAWQQDARQKKLGKNKEEGEEFLAKKAKEPGVKSFPDGLLYKVLASGNGPQPKPEDTVSAHYRGTLIDGTEFDSSYANGRPLVTPVLRLVPGWQEALTNMHVGDKWELYVPSHLAYGERGAGGKIGPNAALIFEMELVGIEPPQPPPAAFTPGPGAAPGSPTIRVQPAPGGSQPVRVQPQQKN